MLGRVSIFLKEKILVFNKFGSLKGFGEGRDG